MIHSNAAFCQNFLKVTIGNRVTHVKEDCMQDDTFWKMGTFESDRHSHSPHSIMRTDAHIAQQK